MKQKNYAPVTPFERQTSHCPLYVAWVVLDEARDYFRTKIPETYAAANSRSARKGFLPIIPSGSAGFKARPGANICCRSCGIGWPACWPKSSPRCSATCRTVTKSARPCRRNPCPGQKRFAKHTSPRPSPPKRRGRSHHFVHGCELLAV